MKILNELVLAIMLIGVITPSMAFAEEKQPEPLRYVNAQNLKIINKGFNDTFGPYTRIPAYLKDSVRPELWERAQCSSGIAIRFATNSKRVGVRYNLLWNTHMAHMADTGLKGTDLYRLSDEGKWEYVNTNRPSKKDSIQSKTYVENLKGDMREFMIYLPLYDGVNWLEVGVDNNSTITKPMIDNPRAGKKIIMYGTSILQGGCSTRTGMVSTSMIQRDLNCEVVNIGISGEGKMDMCMARAMAKIPDAVAFVIDPIPNCTKMMCDTLTYGFVNCLRKLRPEVPIVMVEGPIYPYAKFDTFFGKYLPEKNAAFRKNYEILKKENPKNIYYITTDGLIGDDNEATVDGIHFTDIGFRRYADKLIPVLNKILKNKRN
ncbi:MAG: SGNH/GDSL hydrolase family protein [Muribaculaceae bacterium]